MADVVTRSQELTAQLIDLGELAVAPPQVLMTAIQKATNILDRSNNIFERAEAEHVLASLHQASLMRIGSA